MTSRDTCGIDDEALRERVFTLVYHRLLADAMACGAAGARQLATAPPERFHTQDAMEQARARVVAECRCWLVSEALVTFLSTEWMEQFAPRPN